MSACPSQQSLEALFGTELDDATADSLVDHLGECERCRTALLQMSVELDDWPDWESLLNPSLEWPIGGAGSATSLADTHVFTVSPTSATVKADAAQDLPREFADYELLDRLGAGGMGIVYRARQKSTDRLVALKLIRPEQLELLSEDRREEWLDRFRAEAQTAARLENDFVVTIYDVGEQDGTLYYSMQYVDGPSLAQMVHDGPMENHRAAELTRCVALALDHAHQKGILHRDLKPHNILVRPASSLLDSESESGTPSDSELTSTTHRGRERPYVSDFGLAKCLEEGREGTTHTGDVMGSPSYMSPEQAQDASRCTPASDIYGLGATLYELLTGRPPFRAHSALETLRQVIEQEPVAPRDLNSQIDLDLQTITLKALAKDPSRRYATAATMANDLQRYINGEPIEARPIGRFARSVRWCRRNPVVASLGAGIATLLFVVAIGSIVYSYRLSQHTRRESAARAEAEKYFHLMLNVIDEMLAEFGDETLAHVPQMEQARKDLLRKVIELHERLLVAKPTNTPLRIDFARAQYRIGNLYDLLGEKDHAKSAFAEAIRRFHRLRVERPDDRQLSHDLAACHTMLGETYRETSAIEALQSYEAALDLQRALQNSAPNEGRYSRELSRTLNNLGLLWTETGQFESAESALLEAIQHLSQLTMANDGAADDLADLGRSQINLGVLLRKLPDRAAEAETAYREAIGALERSVKMDHENRDNRFRLAVARFDLANYFVMDAADEKSQSLGLLTLAVESLQSLRNDFPGIPVYRYELANSLSSMAITLAMQDRLDEAMARFAQATDVLGELAEDFPEYGQTVPKYQSLKGRVRGGIAYLEFQNGELASARQHVEQAIVDQQEAARLGPENPEFIEFLGRHHAFLAQIHQQLEQSDEAAKSRQIAEALSRQASEMKAGRKTNVARHD